EEMMTKLDNRSLDTAHSVYLGIYQQLVTTRGGEVVKHYKRYPRDFFDLVVVDECHRSSADAGSNWHEILDYFGEATKIGLTATPKDDEDPSRSNFAYFGEPIYTYSLKQGIEDGFLAPYKVVIPELDIDIHGYTPAPGTTDVDGNPIEIRTYTQREFDRNIIVAERRELVAKRISEYMAANDMRYAKTIVFCEDIPHCQEMVRLLENENADLVAENPHYVQQITGDNEVGKAQLDYFIESKCKYPVIAVTSRLMSTGVNAKTCELIVLDRTIGSMTEFKQIIGRGTRVVERYTVEGEEKSKMYFTIMDFRSNYELFNDPDFDGDPTGGGTVVVPPGGPMPKPPIRPVEPPVPPTPAQNRRVARVNGVEVEIVGEMVRFLDEDGNLVQMNLTSCVRNNILGHYETLEDFRQAWLLTKSKDVMASQLLLEMDWSENFETRYGYKVDPFDIVACIGYDADPPVSRLRRTRSGGVTRFVAQERFDEPARGLLRLMLDAYAEMGFERLRDLAVFNLPQFKAAGWTKLSAVKKLGGKERYYGLLSELENALYEKE
ncbi:MAG: EcoAI/FtnUII family type I restriction enzme subunit R, partial [Parafannyhessea sp.]|uniref:EcoAI/FtnUII family type I restriction enzme subunit R n=1 Tax=Parafannyhessea sp. TaxID=2847324 RepID=UPI003F0661CB